MEIIYKIVLIDDHEIFRDGIELIIDSIPGFKVIYSGDNPYDVIEKIQLHKGAVYLMDISMPAMSGIELARKIRKKNSAAKIIALTSNKDINHFKLAISAGISGYLTKNTTKDELINAIEEVSAGKRFFADELSQDIMQELFEYVKNDDQKNTLTERELDVLREIGKGLTYQEIGDKLSISVKTVEAHRSSIQRKTGLKTTADLIKHAIKLNLIDLN